ncbi:hypothetical protein BCR32DRAFT_237654 [Anaeromyces robustus]|uniref:CBS domain-containing protein n=1 Tax=Anaeromyces robustus TaxID=1754192 RepID=A0A1Y1WIZ3_9FUNG|nr:hypothetical protein BCR32DRAFT_237654 [Anaeromyces robustus]|eukprot:ORX73507.1 hypothetical protein BCR32DRAFT_237654 [Anaeromyces robustus]
MENKNIENNSNNLKNEKASNNPTLNSYYKKKNHMKFQKIKSPIYQYNENKCSEFKMDLKKNNEKVKSNIEIENLLYNELNSKKKTSENQNIPNILRIDTNSSNNNNNNNNNINVNNILDSNYENPFLKNRKIGSQYSDSNFMHNIPDSQRTSSYFSIKRKNNKDKIKTFAGDPTDKTLLENHGMRVRYEDYTTIDWIHDYVRDKARLRKIINRHDIKGQIFKFLDKSIGWILVVFIGMICGVVAAGIEISSKWIFDKKLGYCRRSFSLNRELCCIDSNEYICDEWVTWGSLFNFKNKEKEYLINWIFYGLIASILGLISVLITSLSLKSSKENRIEKIEKHYNEPNSKPKNDSESISRTKHNSIPFETNRKGKNPMNDPNVIHPEIRQYNYQDEKHYLQEDKPEKIYCYAAGSGLPEVKTILSGFVIRGFLGLRTLITKVFGLIFAISSGLTIGSQGPLVHICCCIGNIASRCFKKYKHNEAKKREILSAACSSGVAVAFGAPIGGVLFSFEEVSYYFPQKTMWRSFISAMVAAVTLKYTNPYRTGKAVLFEVEYNKSWHYFELFFFAIIGILGGLFGALFIKINLRWRKIRKSLNINKYPILEVIIIALLSGLLGYINSYARIGNAELIGDLFKECNTKNKSKHSLCDHNELFKQVVKDLLITLIIKVSLTTITLCIRVPCGYFIPTMVVGALSGRIVGICLLRLIKLYPLFSLFSFCPAKGECITPGVYAMLGAAAALCGVTRMTISLVVIMFELTGGVSYVIPIMVTILAAKWTADAFDRNSIFDCLIEENDYPYLNNKKIPIHQKSIVDIMDTNVLTLKVNYKYSVDDLIDILNYKLLTTQYSDDGGFPILDNGILVGYIAFNELEHAIYLVRKLSWDNRPCCFKRIIQNQNTKIDLTKDATTHNHKFEEKKNLKKIFSPLSISLFNSFHPKSFLPINDDENDDEERVALLSNIFDTEKDNEDDYDDYNNNNNNKAKFKATTLSTQNNSLLVDINNLSVPIEMPSSSYYQQHLQHSYMARSFHHHYHHNNNNDNCNTSHTNSHSNSIVSLPPLMPIVLTASTSQSQFHIQTPTELSRSPSEIDNTDENNNNKLNASLTSFNFPLSMPEDVNEEPKDIFNEPLVYPFPDSYYALLLAGSNNNNEEEFVKNGNLIQPEINDFTPWIDQAPLMISVNSSMQLATEMFVRLGTRYLCVVMDGHFVGVIHKKALIKYIRSIK